MNRAQSWSRRSVVRFVNGALALALFVAAPGLSASANFGHRLQSPPEQHGVDSTVSAVETTLYVPASAAPATVNFDWFVDSEPNYDFLRVLVDGALSYSWSGLGRSGHVTHPIATSGSHTLRFEYLKDSSVSRGRDVAWVDNITVSGGGRVIETHHFDVRVPNFPGDWSPSGYAGGLQPRLAGVDRIIKRPQGQAFSGYISSPTTSSIARTITWPAGSDPYLAFDYLIDSEQGWDFLKVLVDGAVVWQISGYGAGNQRIALPSTGAHTVTFQYYKDTSVDVGRDLAAVGNVTAGVGGSQFELHDFEGVGLSTVPDGWSASGAVGGWYADNPPPPVAFVNRGNPSVEPTIDGQVVINPGHAEYVAPTMLPLLDVQTANGLPGTILLREADGTQALYIGLRVHSATPAVGNESGELVLMFDANRPDSLLGIGCGRAPGPEDRKITISYSSTSAQPSWSASQQYGLCQGGYWATLPNPDLAWPLTVTVFEPPGDPGFIHIEARVVLRPSNTAISDVLAQNMVGFGLTHRNFNAGSRENLPVAQGGVLAEAETTRWMTLDFANPKNDPAYGRVYAEPNSSDQPLRFFGAR